MNHLFRRLLMPLNPFLLDAREEIIEILRKRLAEDRREEIAANAKGSGLRHEGKACKIWHNRRS